MTSLYTLSVWIHVVAAATWIGSMVFFAAVAVPVLRREEIRPVALTLMRLLGARFRVLGWIALTVLVVTGVTNLYLRGIGWRLLGDPAFWTSTSFGRALGYKLALVAVVLAATAAHDAIAGTRAARPPRAEGALIDAQRAPAARGGAERSRRNASWLGRFVLLASLAIVYFAVELVRGAP